MRARRKIITACLVVSALTLTACGRREKEALPDITLGVNLLENASFELWDGNVPTGWEIRHLEGDGEVENYYGRSTEEKASGQSSFYIRGLFNVDKWWVLVQRQPVIPGYRLEISAEMKSVNLKVNRGQQDRSNVYIRFLDENGERLSDRYYADAYTRHRLGTGPWSRSAKRATVPKKARYVEIGLINQMTGHLYFDDVELKLFESLNWETEKTKYVTFYYLKEHPIPGDSLSETVRLIERVAKKTHVKPDVNLEYHYYPSEEKLHEILGIDTGYQRINWEEKQLHTTRQGEQYIMLRLLFADLGSPPIGLYEGFAFAMIGTWNGRDIHELSKGYLLQRSMPPLYKVLRSTDIKETYAAITIVGWSSFCKYLIDAQGIDKFLALYRQADGVDEIRAFNDHFRDAYGEDFDVVDRAWRLFLLRYPTGPEGDTLQ